MTLALLFFLSTLARAADVSHVDGTELNWFLVQKKSPEKIIYWDPSEEDKLPSESEAQKRRLEDDKDKRPSEPFHGEGCPRGMVRARGKFGSKIVKGASKEAEELKWTQYVEMRQNAACIQPADFDETFDPRHYCKRYDAEKLKDLKHEKLTDITKDMNFCIDRYEFPNVPGGYPATMSSWTEAKQLCEDQGKRLCEEDEWTYACEGPDIHPYPYGDGYKRDPSACNFNFKAKGADFSVKNIIEYHDMLLLGNDLGQAALVQAKKNMGKHWGAVPSGSYKDCRSYFGVYDLVGNVDEWAVHVNGWPHQGYASVNKGGWWEPFRSRCRPATVSHDQTFRDFNIGFRCCADPTD